MGEHTKEPWEIEHEPSGDAPQRMDSCYIIQDAKPSDGLGCHIAFAFDDPTGESNASRIVAAVNACVGITTEQLEAGVLTRWKEALEGIGSVLTGTEIHPTCRCCMADMDDCNRMVEDGVRGCEGHAARKALSAESGVG